MAFYARSGGAWRLIISPQVRSGGAWRTPIGMWVYSGGVWRQFYFPVIAGSYSSSATGLTAPRVTYLPNGTVTNNAGAGGDWYSPTTAGIGNGYWIKFSLLVGDVGWYAGATRDVWHQLSADRFVQLNPGSIGEYRTISLSVQLSNSSDGVPVLSSGTIDMESQR